MPTCLLPDSSAAAGSDSLGVCAFGRMGEGAASLGLMGAGLMTPEELARSLACCAGDLILRRMMTQRVSVHKLPCCSLHAQLGRGAECRLPARWHLAQAHLESAFLAQSGSGQEAYLPCGLTSGVRPETDVASWRLSLGAIWRVPAWRSGGRSAAGLPRWELLVMWWTCHFNTISA